MRVETAAILAGGLGKRLRPYTDDRPKPMIEIAGKPILEWQLHWLKNLGIKKAILMVGYLSNVIESYFKDGSAIGIRIEYSFEKEPLGTGGALKNASEMLEDEAFYVINGDVITNLDIREMIPLLDSSTTGVIALTPLPSPYGVVKIENNETITGFIEKPLLEDVWINAGVYLLKKEILAILPPKGDIEKTAFPLLSKEKKLKGKKYKGIYWKSIDSHKDLEEVTKSILENKIF